MIGKESGQADLAAWGIEYKPGVLDRINDEVDWRRFEKLLRKAFKESGRGRTSYPPVVLFKALLLQQWYGLSDPMAEEAIGDQAALGRIQARKTLLYGCSWPGREEPARSQGRDTPPEGPMEKELAQNKRMNYKTLYYRIQRILFPFMFLCLRHTPLFPRLSSPFPPRPAQPIVRRSRSRASGILSHAPGSPGQARYQPNADTHRAPIALVRRLLRWRGRKKGENNFEISV